MFQAGDLSARYRYTTGLIKIGFTSRTVEERVVELDSSTGVPDRFSIEAYFPSSSQTEEKLIHEKLAQYRLKNREFFRCSVEEAVKSIQSILNRDPCFQIRSFQNEEAVENRGVPEVDEDQVPKKRQIIDIKPKSVVEEWSDTMQIVDAYHAKQRAQERRNRSLLQRIRRYFPNN